MSSEARFSGRRSFKSCDGRALLYETPACLRTVGEDKINDRNSVALREDVHCYVSLLLLSVSFS